MTRDDLRALALRLLRGEPDPAIRVRLLRDILEIPEDDPRLVDAIAQLDQSPHVQALASEQQPDGSWGRLHSQETRRKQRTATTEVGVERAVVLGLPSEHPILANAAEYLVRVLEGDEVPTDPPERNDRWETGVELFTAATLSRILPDHPALERPASLWGEIVRWTFADGRYDPEAEAEAHRALTGATVAGSYLVLSNRYTLTLLAARSDEIPAETLTALLAWICSNPAGIGYLSEAVGEPPALQSSGKLDRWLASWELLARFAIDPPCTRVLLDALDESCTEDGLWDLGARSSTSMMLPLSDDWRGKGKRTIDWTARILLLYADLLGPASGRRLA